MSNLHLPKEASPLLVQIIAVTKAVVVVNMKSGGTATIPLATMIFPVADPADTMIVRRIVAETKTLATLALATTKLQVMIAMSIEEGMNTVIHVAMIAALETTEAGAIIAATPEAAEIMTVAMEGMVIVRHEVRITAPRVTVAVGMRKVQNRVVAKAMMTDHLLKNALEDQMRAMLLPVLAEET